MAQVRSEMHAPVGYTTAGHSSSADMLSTTPPLEMSDYLESVYARNKVYVATQSTTTGASNSPGKGEASLYISNATIGVHRFVLFMSAVSRFCVVPAINKACPISHSALIWWEPAGVGGIARNVLTSLDYMEHPGTEGDVTEQDKEKADLYLLLQHQERSMQLIRASIQAIERGEGLGGASAVVGVSGGAQGELAGVDEGEHCSYACIHRHFWVPNCYPAALRS
jgi:hypothetical protein